MIRDYVALADFVFSRAFFGYNYNKEAKKVVGYNVDKSRLVVPKSLPIDDALNSKVLLTSFDEKNRFEYGVIKVGDNFYRFFERSRFSILKRKRDPARLVLVEEKDEGIIEVVRRRASEIGLE